MPVQNATTRRILVMSALVCSIIELLLIIAIIAAPYLSLSSYELDVIKYLALIFGTSLTGIATMIIPTSKEKLIIEQPSSWKGLVLYIGAEQLEELKEQLEEVKDILKKLVETQRMDTLYTQLLTLLSNITKQTETTKKTTESSSS